ncbi:ubiquinol-cytochrome C chaperone family protein [Enterovirga sp.]|uniref:ubiquinol-cytochrome C chaperone family protein n=1 Tax=Enterovirga sp. TaxID=2026350 RepID=UPI00263467A9|nr:ubiquinol-cytochrome C chaperone family protein [Enterovirga sp.]MDB5592408.1 ubiquinol-cytochrome chaperone [Enterovirga sp.]
MFGFAARTERRRVIGDLHHMVVEQSRSPALYGPGGLPDTIEGRFEGLTLHVLLLMRRLRNLPEPAEEVAQELVDAVFAHLEIALRESGIGDFGVPKRMKKLARAFYDRTLKYENALSERDSAALSAELGLRLGLPPAAVSGVADHLLAADSRLAGADLDAILSGAAWAGPPVVRSRELAS